MRGILIGLAAAALAAAGCGGEQDGGDGSGGGRLSIATGNTTGVYYQMGGGLARLISQHVPGYSATAEATGASVENIRRVVSGDSDIAFTLADTASDAATGKGAFTEPQPIQALARIYTNFTQVVVRTDAKISSIADMKGKAVSTGSPNSGTEVIALRLLRAAGLDAGSDIDQQKLSLPETVQGMKDGSIQAMFWSGGLPTGGMTDLTTTLGARVRFLPLSNYLPALRNEFGQVYQEATIGSEVYDQPADVPTIGVPNLLVVKDTMDEQLAFALTELLFSRQPDLAKVHPEANNIERATATETAPVPLHPGAQRYLGG